MAPQHIAVIGGGYAGLAAAVTLAERGMPTTLFEAGGTLGGRARGLDWRGQRLDNGQHILLGAYRETLRLMALTGAPPDAVLRLPLTLAAPGHFALATPSLPAPLHLLAGLLRARGLSWRERLGAIRFAMNLRLSGFRLTQDESVADLLRRHRQHGETGRLLWEPLCLAALNTPIAHASAQVFLNVLRDSFSRSRSDSDLILPRLDLSALFPESAARFIRDRGAKLRHNTRIRSIARRGKSFVLAWDGDEDEFSHVVCATAPWHASALLAGLPELAGVNRALTALPHQPIATVYLQYPETVRLPRPMLGLHGGHAQWVLDRGWTHGTPGLLAAVISAGGPHLALPRAQLAQAVHAELRRIFDLPPPLWHEVITEKRATFSCDAGLERPAQTTPLENFYLAGDYTAGDYPATIEGAVRSGIGSAMLVADW